jgi:hypothetical protein
MVCIIQSFFDILLLLYRGYIVTFMKVVNNYYSALKQEILSDATMWIEFEIIMLNEINHSQKKILQDSIYVRYMK